MDLRQIQYFACLYEEGSVTRAAQRLHIVQPALSMQIAKLEAELEKKLFTRTRQGMEPTQEAHRLYRLFMPVLNDFAHAREQALHTESGELRGQVRLGMIASVTQGVLAEVVHAFTTAYPRVALSLTDGYSGPLIEAVTQGQLDAAIVNKPRRPLALATKALTHEELLLVTGPRHPPLPAEVPFHAVEQLKLVLPTRRHGLRGILEDLARGEGVNLAPALEIDALGVLLKLVDMSEFSTLLPRITAGYRTERIHRVVAPVLTRQIICVTHPRRPLNPASMAFVKLLTQHIQNLSAASVG